MSRHDLHVTAAETEFRTVPFAHPLVLSSGTITGLTEARVRVHGRTRGGVETTGLGSVLLSHVWAGSADAPMRAAVARLAAAASGADAADPVQHGVRLLDRAATLDLPALAASVALAPVDQAVHDAWSRAIGASAYQLYREPYLDADLGHYLGPDFTGHWPHEWLARTPRTTLDVQYVLGLSDPVEAARGYRSIKVKLAGDPARDIARTRAAAALGVRISLDPNEGYRSSADLAGLLGAVSADYVEQPTPRDRPGPGTGAIPVLVDEGLPDPRRLDGLTGWDGIVVKTCRGQTAALLAYCWARRRGRFVVQQDLTHVGPALAHAAAFAAHCDYTVSDFECNSLQYAPAGNAELARTRPGLVTIHEGMVTVPGERTGIR